jgi:uncharacterized protein YhaN
MKIKKLEVFNFRQIDHKEYTFKDGINIISGPNESGKTTLFYVIISSLFDNPKKIRKTLLDSYKSWGKEEYPIIDFTLEKDNIDYVFHKDFNTKVVTLNGENIDNLDKLMLDLISIDRVVFEKLSCVYQNQIASIEKDSKTLEKSILDIVSSTSMNGINVLDAISKVSKKIQNMNLGLDHVSKNMGIIKSLDLEISNLTEKLNLAKEEFNSFSNKFKDLEKMKKEKSDMEKIFEENKVFLDKVKKAKDLNFLNKDITSKMKEIDSKITRLNKLYIDLDTIKKKFLPKEFDRMNNVQNDLYTLRNNIEIREKDLAEVVKKKEEVDKMDLKAVRKNSPIVVFISILLFIITVISVFFGYYLLISIFIDIVFIGVYLRFVDYNRLENFKNPAIESITQIENEINSYKASISSILTSFNVLSIDDFFRKKTEMLSLKEELLKVESTIKGILGSDTLASLESSISDLSVQKRDINTEFTEDLKDFISVDTILLNKKRIENEELDLDLFTLNEDIIALEARISDNKISNEDIEDIELTLKTKKEERSFYVRRVKILEIVEENLKKAKSDAIEEISLDLNKLGNDWIKKITKGKYNKIDIVNNDKLSVIEAKNDKILNSSDFLSTGLMDQVYLLSRLSILNVVLKDKSNIMMFDDPFINFDKERLSITIDLLKYFSKFNQIFLFTCHNFFDSIN